MRWWRWMWFKQGQIEVECGVGCDCGSGECGDKCGDGDAEETSPAGILPNPSHLPNNTPNNQSKPIVPIPSFSLSFPLITFRYTSYNFSL